MKWKNVKEGDIIYSGDWYAVFLKIELKRDGVTVYYFNCEPTLQRRVFSATEEVDFGYTILEK